MLAVFVSSWWMKVQYSLSFFFFFARTWGKHQALNTPPWSSWFLTLAACRSVLDRCLRWGFLELLCWKLLQLLPFWCWYNWAHIQTSLLDIDISSKTKLTNYTKNYSPVPQPSELQLTQTGADVLFHWLLVVLSLKQNNSACFFFEDYQNLLFDRHFSLQTLFEWTALRLNSPVYIFKTVSPFDNSHLPLWHLSQQLHMTLNFIPAAFQSSGQRQTEQFLIAFSMPTYSLTEALFVIRLLLLSAKLLVVFPSEAADYHMLYMCQWETENRFCPYTGRDP